MISGGDNMIAYLDLNPHKVFNSSGLPIRSDLSVQLQGVVQMSHWEEDRPQVAKW